MHLTAKIGAPDGTCLEVTCYPGVDALRMCLIVGREKCTVGLDRVAVEELQAVLTLWLDLEAKRYLDEALAEPPLDEADDLAAGVAH
jgi:hypothetical protein